MLRLACLLPVALVLVGCDAALPERSNPYDPAFGGVRLVNPPDTLRLADASPTSVTLTWPDASSFESGYRLESLYGGAPVDLPPNTTSYRVEGLRDAAGRSFVVRTIGDAEGVSDPTAALSVAYPTLPGVALTPRPDCRRGAALIPARDRLYCVADGGGAVAVYDLRFETDGAGRVLARFGAYDAVVGPLASGAVVLGSQAERTRRAYAVVDGAQAVRTGEVVSPGGPFVGPMAASPDGTRLAALYTVDPEGIAEDAALAVYDLATGALLAAGLGGPMEFAFLARLHLLTDAGTLVYSPDVNDLVGWDASVGAEAWSRTAQIEGRPFDPVGGQLFVYTASGAPVVLDADTGDETGRVTGVLLEALPRGEVLVGLGDIDPGRSGVVVWDIATGAVVRGRAVGGGDVVWAAGVDGDTLVYVAGGRAERLALRATWQRATAD